MASGAEHLAVGVAGVAASFDLATKRIPNLLTYSALFAALGLALQIAVESGSLARLGGMATGFVPCLALFWLGGLGGGDVKLVAALGGLLGATQIVDVLLVSVFLGALAALPMIAWSRSLRVSVPFAIPLFVGVVLVVAHGPIAWNRF